ncbi:aa3 type cytochrome c oxidase subunit IV [Tranquillimonas rosea]|uniref:Aa3 type cytochrome c oxidase subunit IV n=1 Tax=Tranquillimonas rosea TaxID=641238 RepID=A0A1H9R4S7_9RHOB|nr:aa3-type cytochrome c oxidase subunit IV [Tranquillimonas rosea]SER67535.1 aa3 type cytochrome c oxidase subunit IV [Tranquillimonas rosea]
MAEQQHKHEHGSMDIDTQEKTFEGFVKWVTWSTVAIIVALILLAIFNG